MIITTSNPDLATASVIDISIGLEIIVNTNNGMVLSFHGSEHIVETGLMSRFWTFSDEERPEEEVTIKVTPENIGEEVSLKGIEYSNHDRGQFCFLLISLTQLIDRAVLATTDIPENDNAL